MAEHHNGATSGEELVRSLYEEVESQTASALEQLVAKPSFGRLLAISGENVAALARIGSDTADLVLRNLRLAGRADITAPRTSSSASCRKSRRCATSSRLRTRPSRTRPGARTRVSAARAGAR